MIETNIVGLLDAKVLVSAVIARGGIGAALAAAVAATAYVARALSRSGAAAAVVCGAISAAAGWPWAVLLVAYFVTTTIISRSGREHKEARSASVVAKGGRRDAAQVFANGGAFVAAAAISLVSSSSIWLWGGLGALAASAADTWSTEIGLLYGGTPRSILTRTIVRGGESGGVTGVGTLGGVLGAATVAAFAVALRFPTGAALASIVAGVGGTLADSLLGATLQERRYCDACGERTERAIHSCGAVTRHTGGIRSLDNDVVNALATIVGLALGVMLEVVVGNGTLRGWRG